MRLKQAILLMLAFGACTSSSVALDGYAEQNASGGIAQTFTLYPPRDKSTGKYDESRACFSFKFGANKQPSSVEWELGYGFAQISNEDWLTINTGRPDQRSVLKGLGKRSWADSFRVPALEPLPELMEGQRREVTIDASAGTHAAWANSTTHFAKATVGNMYVMHVKDDQADFYVLFRIEQLEQGEQCTISWKRIPNP